MDGNGKKPLAGKKTARPAPAAEAATQQPADVRPALSSSDDAAARQQVDDDGQPVASVDESRAGAGGADEEDNHHDDDDEEEVERFYALLANIRAMRGLPPPPPNMVASSSACDGGGNVDDSDTAGDDCTRKKRLRLSAAPWRPAFRMEDFEEPAPTAAASCEMMTKPTRGAAGHDDHGHGHGSPPVAVVASPSSSLDAARGGTVPTVVRQQGHQTPTAPPSG